MKKVSIITSTYNSKKMTLAYLKELYKLNYKNLEVILIDDASNDGTYEAVSKRFKKVILIRNKVNLGFGKSNNKGIRKATGDFIILLNNDVLFPDKDLINTLIKVYNSHKKVGMIICKVIGYDGRIQNKINNVDTEHELNLSGGPLMFFKSSVLKKVGGFDEDFSPAYFEDIDLSLRLRKKGYKLIYTPKTHIIHKGGGTTKGRTDFFYKSIFKNGIQFSIIYMDLPYFLVFTTRELLRAIYRHKFLIYAKSWFYNIKMLKRLLEKRKNRRIIVNFFKNKFN